MLHGFRMVGIFNTQEEIDAWAEQDGAIPGVYKYEDTNDDGVITYDTPDMVEIGNPHPKFVWGFTLGGDYKNFDLNLDRKSTRLHSSHYCAPRMQSSA